MFLNGCFSQPGFHEKGKFTQLSWSLHSPNGQNCFQLLGTPWTGMKFTKATFQQVTGMWPFGRALLHCVENGIRNVLGRRGRRMTFTVDSKWWKFIKSMAPNPLKHGVGCTCHFYGLQGTQWTTDASYCNMYLCTYISRDLCSIWWKYILIIYDYAMRLSCTVLWIIISLPQVLGGHASPTVWTA